MMNNSSSSSSNSNAANSPSLTKRWLSSISVVSSISSSPLSSSSNSCRCSSSSSSSRVTSSSLPTSSSLLVLPKSKSYTAGTGRTWTQSIRLWLLRSRTTIILWHRLLAILSTISMSSWTLFVKYHYNVGTTILSIEKERSEQQQQQQQRTASLLVEDNDAEEGNGYRQLFHDLSMLKIHPPFTTIPIFAGAAATATAVVPVTITAKKPIMMGVLWKEDNNNNSNELNYEPDHDDYYTYYETTNDEKDNDDYYGDSSSSSSSSLFDNYEQRQLETVVSIDPYDFTVTSLFSSSDKIREGQRTMTEHMLFQYNMEQQTTPTNEENSNNRYYQNIFLPRSFQRHQYSKPKRRHVVFDIDYAQPLVLTSNSEYEDPNIIKEQETGRVDWTIPDGCEMQYKWQNDSYPTCNTFHELDISNELTITNTHINDDGNNYNNNNNDEESLLRARLLAAGGYRNVWMIRNRSPIFTGSNDNPTTNNSNHQHNPLYYYENPVALKTLLYERDWYKVYFQRHNLDALVTSRLQSSQYITNIYGYCGNSGMYEYAKGGNLMSYMDHLQQQKYERRNYAASMDSRRKLELAYNVVRAIADLHNKVGKEGQPVVAHTDIFPDQFIRVDVDNNNDDAGNDNTSETPLFKLNDFNRARWIHVPSSSSSPSFSSTSNTTTDSSCGFTFPRNRGNFRSPEEYAYELETEKIDVYSMGNVLYYILVGEIPFKNKSQHTIKNIVLKKRKRQHIPSELKYSTDPIITTIVKAIKMCWIHKPTKRPTSRQVEQHLYQFQGCAQ